MIQLLSLQNRGFPWVPLLTYVGEHIEDKEKPRVSLHNVVTYIGSGAVIILK